MYAQIVLRNKGRTESTKVYAMILKMYPNFGKVQKTGAARIHSSLAEIECLSGNHSSAILALMQYCDTSITSFSATGLLKVRKWYRSEIEKGFLSLQSQTTSSSIMDELVSLIYNAAFLELLCHKVEAAVELMSARISESERNSLLRELLYIHACKVVCLSVSTSSSTKLGTLRNLLENALEEFPHNTLLLTLYGWNEGVTKMDNRIRRFLNQKRKTTPSHILTHFSVWTELHQRSALNIEVIRSLLEESLFLKSSKASLQTWLLAIDFERVHGTMERAKTLVLQAIASCPWSKGIQYSLDLYLIAFGPLHSQFSTLELEDLYTMMNEHELRIFQPLEQRINT
jgi:hypothetical protein